MAVIRRALDPCGRTAVWAVPARGRPEVFVGTGCLPAFSPLSDREKGPEKVVVEFWESAPSKQIENEDD